MDNVLRQAQDEVDLFSERSATLMLSLSKHGCAEDE